MTEEERDALWTNDDRFARVGETVFGCTHIAGKVALMIRVHWYRIPTMREGTVRTDLGVRTGRFIILCGECHLACTAEPPHDARRFVRADCTWTQADADLVAEGRN